MRKERKFNPLAIPKALQAALPFASKVNVGQRVQRLEIETRPLTLHRTLAHERLPAAQAGQAAHGTDLHGQARRGP